MCQETPKINLSKLPASECPNLQYIFPDPKLQYTNHPQLFMFVRQVYTKAMNNQQFRRGLRRIIRTSVKLHVDKERNIHHEFQPIIDKNNSIVFRIFWALLVAVCILIYSYQMFDRISYYVKSPIAVDVYEEKLEVFKFPNSHVCVPLNNFQVIQNYFAYDMRHKVHIHLNITTVQQLNPMGTCTKMEGQLEINGFNVLISSILGEKQTAQTPLEPGDLNPDPPIGGWVLYH
uniref:Uncharacterized protein n=1 Tax=Strigamia maritima TaxID=126957 RepID=T1JLE2_STRMM